MRPVVSLDIAKPRSRHSSAGEGARPTAFFLTRDTDLHSVPHVVQPTEHDASSLRTLEETIDETTRPRYSLSKQHIPEARSSSRRRSTIKPQLISDHKTQAALQQHPDTSSPQLSVPLTPPLLPSRDESLSSSPKSLSSRSLQRSDEESVMDEAGSQAIASSDDDEEDKEEEGQRAKDSEQQNSHSDLQDSSPQLVMPSIKMPSRRPFTERGKMLGNFKILVTGSRGCGRTSLIKSMVQICEDIVHVDPASAPGTRRMSHSHRNTHFDEVYASTKPYPAWWSDIDESRVLKRRKSMGDAVLERNICFVDMTDSGTSDKDLEYVEQQFIGTLNKVAKLERGLAGLLSGEGGSQVDVILFLMNKDTEQRDYERIQRLSRVCNVIPLISKADLLAPGQISDLKATFDNSSTAMPFLPPSFNTNDDGTGSHASAPYTVSSANGPDFDTMDASLLMSPDYVQPLIATELASLVNQLFNPTAMSYLRYSTAKKLITWYASSPKFTQAIPSSPSAQFSQHSNLTSPLQTSLSNSGMLVPITSELSLNTSNSYTLARVADHAQREEHLAQIRLSKWATDLQLSLQRERERYERIARNERAAWLVQRMGEEVKDGTLVPISALTGKDAPDSNDLRANTAIRSATAADKQNLNWPNRDFLVAHDVHDPLGLLRWQDSARTRGWIALQVLGSFGVVGGVALWLARTWGLTTSFHDWAVQFSDDWLR